jgi:thiol-disulfide isomerase/thioredoxin
MMLNVTAILFASVLGFSGVHQGAAPSADNTFPLLAGKTTPLTLQLKDLDSSWRVFTASSSTYENILASAMTGGDGNKVFTRGDTVTVGTEIFLVTYKPDAPDVSSMFGGGGTTPKVKPLTETTVVRLSLLNLHALGAMDGIRVFDLRDIVSSDSKQKTVFDMIEKKTSSGDDTAEHALLSNGTVAPDFVVHDDKGGVVKLSSYRGKVVVIDFWATWCGPCQESLPGTNAIAAKYASKNVVVLGVNVWDTKNAFHDWLPSHKKLSSIKFAIDTRTQGQDVATKLYHVSGIPTQYVIDKKGRIVKALVGSSEDESELTNGIKTALSHG